MAAPIESPKYEVYHELDVADCDPELIATVDTLSAAWDVVRKDLLGGHQCVPDECPHPDAFPRLPDRAAMKGAGVANAIFAVPTSVAADGPIWIAVAGGDTYFAYLGQWAEFCDLRNEQATAKLLAACDGQVTFLGPV